MGSLWSPRWTSTHYGAQVCLTLMGNPLTSASSDYRCEPSCLVVFFKQQSILGFNSTIPIFTYFLPPFSFLAFENYEVYSHIQNGLFLKRWKAGPRALISMLSSLGSALRVFAATSWIISWIKEIHFEKWLSYVFQRKILVNDFDGVVVLQEPVIWIWLASHLYISSTV